ncbi:MAG TPA: NAD(P)H-quinone oxidoreductase [Steroidobacteraceae bacterium]|nr:NAD(P)H-quinone oxidoreductase [Steroidobacteraceae bacterium]
MRQVVVRGAGGPEVMSVAQAPVPVPAAGEVLIRVAAAGINRPDLSQRQGSYPPPPGASPILGLEVAGWIAALGAGVDQWQVGDAVCALTPGGGYSEYVCTPASHCLPVPRGLSLLQAAALPETAFTVWTNVFERGRLQAGEHFLVHGGSSGIGTMAIQLARAFGAHVLATAGSAPKCAYCLSLGAERVINHRSEDFVAAARDATAGRGVDLILDMVGGSYVERNLHCLAPDGRLVQIAFLSGSRVTVDLNRLLRQRLTLTGSTLRPRSIADKAAIAAQLRARVWPLLDSGQVRVVIHRTYPLEAVQDAHRELERGQHLGKIVLDVASEATRDEIRNPPQS